MEQSSGDPKLDSDVIAAVGGVNIGPPPGGGFTARLPLHFRGKAATNGQPR
jgi:hypothetical protein